MLAAGVIIHYHTNRAMSRRNLYLLLAIVIIGAGLALAASFLHDGLSARATPSAAERLVAKGAQRLSIPSSARQSQNPVLGSAEEMRDARLHYADHCAICHANNGSGDTMMGRGLYPKPPDLRLPVTQNLTDGELFWIIENGIRFTGMPAFANGGEHGGVQDSWKLVHFIRHLPHLTEAERIEMERYNPKGPDDLAEEKQENDFLNEATPVSKPASKDRKD